MDEEESDTDNVLREMHSENKKDKRNGIPINHIGQW